jgi:carbon-monoxide dehydrogenase medium subunit
MIPTSFDYARAGSLKEALNALATGDGTKVVAGGHSLLPMMKFRLAQPPKLVDIGRLADLKGIAENRKGARIGAGVTYRELLDSELLKERFPIIAECTAQIGDVQVRNRGTIGGSVAHADPASDMPAVMLVLDAQFALRSKRGKRVVAAREFFQGPFATALAEDELLIDIVLPGPPRGAGMAYVTHRQAASGYAIAAAAAIVGRTRKTISHISVATTGVGDVSKLVESVQALVGTKAGPEEIRAAAAKAADGIEVQGDIHAPAEYRRHLATVVVRKAIERAIERAR